MRINRSLKWISVISKFTYQSYQPLLRDLNPRFVLDYSLLSGLSNDTSSGKDTLIKLLGILILGMLAVLNFDKVRRNESDSRRKISGLKSIAELLKRNELDLKYIKDVSEVFQEISLQRSEPYNLYLPGSTDDLINTRNRVLGKFQCIWILRDFDPKKNKESYYFLGNEFLRLQHKDKPLVPTGIGLPNDFIHLDPYRTYCLHDFNTILCHEMGNPNILKDIVLIIYYYHTGPMFKELDPRTSVIPVPKINSGEIPVLESLIILDGFLNAPNLKEMMGNLKEIDKMDIFLSVLSFYKHANCHNADNGMKIFSCEQLILKFLNKLNPQDDVTLERDIRRAFKSKEEYERNKSIDDGIYDMLRVFTEPRTLDYLPFSQPRGISREEIRIQMLLYSLILQKISVFPNDKICSDKNRLLRNIFLTFNNQNLIILNDRSIDGNEGFFYRDAYSDESYWHIQSSHDYNKYFVYGDEHHSNTLKHKIDERRPGNIGKMIDFMAKGIRFYDWMNNYHVPGSSRKDTRMSIDSLLETVSFWDFKVKQYLYKETEFYISNCSEKDSSYKIREGINIKYLESYLSSIQTMLFIDQNKGIRFGLKYLDRDTAYKVIDGTDPDLGTFIRSQNVFLKFLKVSRDIPLIDINNSRDLCNGDENALLRDWANRGLCRFKWHGSLMSHLLKKVNENHELDRINMGFLINIDREVDISYELDLYIRIYALIALQKNLLQQVLQLIIYSGLNSILLIKFSSFFEDYKHHYIGYPHKIYHDSIINERKDFKNHDINEKSICMDIKKLLDFQREIMRCNGPEVFTYSSIDTGSQDNVSGSKGSADDYDLSEITPHQDTYDWHQYDVIRELSSIIKSKKGYYWFYLHLRSYKDTIQLKNLGQFDNCYSEILEKLSNDYRNIFYDEFNNSVGYHWNALSGFMNGLKDDENVKDLESKMKRIEDLNKEYLLKYDRKILFDFNLSRFSYLGVIFPSGTVTKEIVLSQYHLLKSHLTWVRGMVEICNENNIFGGDDNDIIFGLLGKVEEKIYRQISISCGFSRDTNVNGDSSIGSLGNINNLNGFITGPVKTEDPMENNVDQSDSIL